MEGVALYDDNDETLIFHYSISIIIVVFQSYQQ